MTGPEPWLLMSADWPAGSGLGIGDSRADELVASGDGGRMAGDSDPALGVAPGGETANADEVGAAADRLATGGEYGAPRSAEDLAGDALGESRSGVGPAGGVGGAALVGSEAGGRGTGGSGGG